MAALTQLRLTSQLVMYYFTSASLKQDEILYHPPWGFKVPVLNWLRTQAEFSSFSPEKEKLRAKGYLTSQLWARMNFPGTPGLH